MTNNKMTEGVGRKIVEALKMQSDVEITPIENEDFEIVEETEETFQPVMPRADEKNLLHISSSTPCTLLERFSYENDDLVEFTKSIVRGDKYVFRSELIIPG